MSKRTRWVAKRTKAINVEKGISAGVKFKETSAVNGKYISGHVHLQNRKSGQYYVKRLSDEEREILEKRIKARQGKNNKHLSHSSHGTAVIHDKRPGGPEGGGGTNGRKPIVHVRWKR